MGGKRELRRCMSESLMKVDDKPTTRHIIPRDQTTTPQNHVPTFCPIAIHIDECSDNEAENEPRQAENDHVNNSTNHMSPTHALSPPASFQTVNGGMPTKRPSVDPQFSSSSSSNFLEVPDTCELSTLKATAVRLNLRIRTSSFLEWQSTWLDNSRAPPQFPVDAEQTREGADKLTVERKERINQALDWLKTELKEMRSMDQHLARQLLTLRHDIHQLRLRRSCQEHRDLLDDVQSELEEQVEMSDVLDLPNDLRTLNDTPLKQIGVTRMNISARRFSMC